MKVLLAPMGSHGDVHPFMALGVELARRGHDVVVITNGAYRTLSERLGLSFVEMGTAEEFREALRDPAVWRPIRGGLVLLRTLVLKPMRLLYQRIAEHYEPGRTVALNSPLGLGARIAQEKLGVPLATVHLAPLALRSAVQPPVLPGLWLPSWTPAWGYRLFYWLADRLMSDRLAAAPVNQFRAELGLPPETRLFGSWWNSPQRILGLFPDWFGPLAPDWPPQTRLTGFPLFDEHGLHHLPEELERFLDAGEPPLVFTPGSAMMHGHEFFRAAVEACRLLGRRGILLTSFEHHLPAELPEGVCSFRYVPFSEVLPRSAALVHHGGIGSTAQGLAAGVPQLFMPMGFDQPDNAARVVGLGAGAVVMPKKFRGVNVARALERLLTGGVRSVCQEIAGRLRGQDAVGKTCDWIEELPAAAVGRVSTLA